MNCKNCGGKVYNGCCLKCGLMDNGNFVKHNDTTSKYNDIRKYNEDFDTMYHNDNWYIPFFMGHLYFSYRNYFLFGIIIEFFEIFFQTVAIRIQESTIFQDIISTFVTFVLSFIIIRIIISIIANPIIIFFDKKKVKLKYKQKKFKSILKFLLHVLIDIYLWRKFGF